MARLATFSAAILLLLLVFAAVAVSGHSIKHVIVLMEENRAFDHMLGSRPGVDGVTPGQACNYVDPANPQTSKKVCVTQNAKNVAPCDPNHDLPPTSYKIYGPQAYAAGNLTNPDMSGFVAFEGSANGNGNAEAPYCAVMDGFSQAHLPVMNGIADHFALFDKFFAAIPGPTWPNRIMFMSATSGGLTETSNPWFFGQTGQLFPMRTIFDQVADAGLTWKNYVNDTPWELFMESIAHQAQNVVLLDEFFEDCKKGTLPNFAFINPRAGVNLTHGYGSNDHHPDHDVALGELYYKDIYEAVRASPSWNDTLLILTYDEHGGFYDHVPPPQHAPAPGDGIPSYPDQFSFDRLGVRIPTLLMSPWVPKGEVIGEPPSSVKPAPDSAYDLTSIMATVRKILKIPEGPLTARDGWSATFEHVLEKLTEPRTDCPWHLPEPMAPAMLNNPENLAKEAAQAPNSLQKHISTVVAHLSGEPAPPKHKNQGEVSPWLMHHVEKHKARTAAWRKSKQALGGHPLDRAAALHRLTKGGAKLSPHATEGKHHERLLTTRLASESKASSVIGVKCEPFIGQVPSYLASNWSVSMNNTTPFRTVSIAVAPSPEAKPVRYCMDAGDLESYPAPATGAVGHVGLSLCYPDANPTNNRDRSQQWVHTAGTLRPFHRQDLCLTSACLAISAGARGPGGRMAQPVTLEPCNPAQFNQHFAWQGPSAGNSGNQDEGMLSQGDSIFALVVDYDGVAKAMA